MLLISVPTVNVKYLIIVSISFRPGEEVPSDLSSITPDRQYEAFILHGEFNYSKEIYIGPRTLISDDSGITAQRYLPTLFINDSSSPSLDTCLSNQAIRHFCLSCLSSFTIRYERNKKYFIQHLGLHVANSLNEFSHSGVNVILLNFAFLKFETIIQN